ncbi:hypothetical protein TrCOL_g8839 [Triparma columacea]|uniref:ZC3H15/TMA46 family C-terminal domain-containing protein n=1 Tax=Triparma columacea TaxID=722753 RepID=A0A9W7GQG3_9STRA|nr:hypothetical protein TrCOL_g8839 [Triparma columacea]
MPSKKKKDDGGKKADQKKKKQMMEDKTFGLKNKNKSKKVQQFVQSTEKSIMNGGNQEYRKQQEVNKMKKAANKAAKKAAESERDALFGEALLAVSKKTTTKMKGGNEAVGRDGGDDEKKVKPGQSRAMKLMYQMDAQEMKEKLEEDPNYVRTIEDEIEMRRQEMVAKLKEKGAGTPVTEETLKVWQEKKRKRKADEAKKLVEAEMKKKKGGKGLSVLSGRALYEYNKSLFVDDENANDVKGLPKEEEGEGGGEENIFKFGKGEAGDVAASAVEKVQIDEAVFLEGDDDDLDDIE